jgi:Siphovirus ReqiPepy6 Gp37-like protein
MAVLVEELDLATLKRGRPIVFNKIDITVGRNEAGPFVLEMPANERNWDLIQLDGNGDLIPVGLTANWNGVYDWFGRAEEWGYRKTITDGVAKETLILTGADGLSLLANRIAYPNPAAAWSAQTIASTVYGPDPAETVIKDIIVANLKTAGDTTRRAARLTVATDEGRGADATYKVVTPNPDAETGTETTTVNQSLMDMIRAVDEQAPIVADLTLGDGEIIFDVHEPRDLSEKAVFSAALGNLAEAGLSSSDPTGNAILTQSKVTGATFTQSNGIGYDDPWRRVEIFNDQSSTDTAADIATQTAATVASHAGRVRISATVIDLPRLRFGRDATGVQGYLPGDIATLDIRDGVTYTDVIAKVQLVADTTGEEYAETVTPTIGRASDDGDDQTIDARLSAKLRRLERALRGSV